MVCDPEDEAPLNPSFFEVRLLVEIETWDWSLHVGLSTQLTPKRYRFQGGLNYGRSVEITGRILAPREHRGGNIRVWMSPFGPKMRFGPRDMDEVGRLYLPSPTRGFRATLMIPEEAIPTTVVCLNFRWKHLHLWTFDADDEEASVRDYSFSATLSEKVKPWAEGR
jgi:hypothetical protein